MEEKMILKDVVFKCLEKVLTDYYGGGMSHSEFTEVLKELNVLIRMYNTSEWKFKYSNSTKLDFYETDGK